MRVTANEDLTFHYELMSYSVPKGTVIEGAAAQHLLSANAAVTEVDEAPAKNPADGASDELHIDGKIEDVLAWVGDDIDRALVALEAEEAKGDKARPRLLAKLNEIN